MRLITGALLRLCAAGGFEALIAVQTTNESWYEADIHRIAGEIALRSPEPDVAKAEAHFERALQVALVQLGQSPGNSAPP